MHETLDAALDLNESTVVGDVGDLAEHAAVLRIAAGDADPRILAELLQAEGDAVLLAVELENLGFDFLTNLNDFARVTDAAPCEVGDVEQAVNAAQINEGTVVGDVLDNALDDGAFLQGGEKLGALFTHAGLDDGTAGNDNVVALAVELDDLEFHGLAFVRSRILNRAGVNEGTGQERTDAVGHDGETALDLAGDGAGHELAGFQSLLQVHPGGQTLGLVARQDRVAVAVFNRLDCHRNEVAGLDGDFTAVVLELLDGHISLRLQAGIDNDEVVVNADHFSGDDFTLTHFLLGKALFKELGKRFGVSSVGHENKKLKKKISPLRAPEFRE